MLGNVLKNMKRLLLVILAVLGAPFVFFGVLFVGKFFDLGRDQVAFLGTLVFYAAFGYAFWLLCKLLRCLFLNVREKKEGSRDLPE